ncbi:unnamed protein product [Hydatigera taeniaeformis]|uniref:Protein SMG9 n=1 Tax=Hydatigena taeniaeformis TaxID=6205 RepID=A0A0R3X1X9_HYDTA|nr:unnamed protein product [Hydatigera taeniaeformis]
MPVLVKKPPKMASSVYDFFTNTIPIDPAVAANTKDELYSLCDDPMTEPMKLINENLKFEDNRKLRGCFIENSGFLVVGVIGLQGVGKSSVANLFANRLVEGPPFESPFPVQTLDSLVEGYPKTTAGVDIYITQDRVILLDTQPLIDWSLTDLHIQCNLRTQKQQRDEHEEVIEVTGCSSTSGKWSVDGFAEITSLQLVSFLVSVCHVVVCVQDNLSNPFFLRLIDRAFGWKPLVLIDDIVTTPNFGMGPSILKSSRRQPHPNPLAVTVESEVADVKAAKPEVTAAEEEEGEVAVDEEEEEGGVACENEAPESNETGLGQTPTTALKVCTSSDAVVVAAAAASASRTGMGAVEEVAEQAEVRDFVNHLLRLTDYTANLVHVYNCAPVEAFLNPRITDDRLSAYRRLLTQAFPARLQLASLVKMGPHILQRHMISQRKRLHEQKQQVAATAASTSNVDMDGEIQLISALDLTEQNTHEISAMKSEASMEATEAEIIAECCEELEIVAKGARSPQKGTGKSCITTTATVSPLSRSISKAVSNCAAGKVFNGEDRVAALKDFSRCVMEGRRTHLEPSASISSPRLFLLPATNENGEVAFGSPTYMQCAYQLQEAILSTPRHHPAPSRSNMTEIQWFDFARQTWNSLAPTSSSSSSCSSYLSDYHRLFVSNSL